MKTNEPLPIPAQENVIPLTLAKERINNWANFIKSIYGKHDNNYPHASFIELIDIQELAKLQSLVREIPNPKTGEMESIYIVAVRSYYAMSAPVTSNTNLAATDFPLDSLLVPVYQTNYREPGSEGEFNYNPKFPTYDLIMPVPSVKGDSSSSGESDYSIYDVTLPCPSTCDPESPFLT